MEMEYAIIYIIYVELAYNYIQAIQNIIRTEAMLILINTWALWSEVRHH